MSPLLPSFCRRALSSSVSTCPASGASCLDVRRSEADRLADTRAVVVVHEEQVPQHPLLHVALALAEQVAEVLRRGRRAPSPRSCSSGRAPARSRCGARSRSAVSRPRTSGGLFGAGRLASCRPLWIDGSKLTCGFCPGARSTP